MNLDRNRRLILVCGCFDLTDPRTPDKLTEPPCQRSHNIGSICFTSGEKVLESSKDGLRIYV